MFKRDFIECERALIQDTIFVRWRDIRALTAGVGEGATAIEGTTTIYMEGELGFIVNHTQAEIIAMIEERQITQ